MEKQFCPYCMTPVEPGEPCGGCGLTAGSYTPSPHHLPPGTVLRERYLVGRVLGEGGFGITYIGCDLRLELKVAIKEYFPTDRANRMAAANLSVSSYAGAAGERYEAGKRRFLREARTMAKMDKVPVIVGVRDFFEAYNTAYIVMEYIEGTTLKELVVQRGGRIPVWELLHITEPLFGALTAMHGLGLIHRDISPENLMLERGEVRLLDFGCARESADGDATLTVALKHGYAPVEQYQSKGQGPWTDVYALAATLYYCLTGRRPPQAMDRLVEDELVTPRQLGTDLTQRQEQALLRAMAPMRQERFQSAEEFHTALYEGLEMPPILDGRPDVEDLPAVEESAPPAEMGPEQQAGPPGWMKQAAAWLQKNRAAAAGIAAALVLVAAVLLWRPWAGSGAPSGNPPDEDPPAVGAESEPASAPEGDPEPERDPAPEPEPVSEPEPVPQPRTVRIGGEDVPLDAKELFLADRRITDLSPLAALTELRRLDLIDNAVSDLSALSGLTRLEYLNLSGNQVSDLTPLENLTSLMELLINGNQVSDLSPLSGLTQLVYLGLDGNRISDVSPLAGLTNLQQLHLDDNQISDIGSLKKLKKLTELTLPNNQIADISVVSGMTELTSWLRLGGNPFTDLSPLHTLTKLKRLEVSGKEYSQEQREALLAALPDCEIDW